MEQTLTKNTFQKYSEYKDSGVDWLGEVPEGWEILPGLSFILEGKDKNKGMKRNTVLSLSYGNIRIKGEDELTGLVPESFETYQLVNKGDLIFRPTDLQNDKVSLRSSISNYEGIITSAYLNLRFKTKAFPKFYHYLFRAIDNNKVIYGLGSGLRQNISYLDFRRLLFPFPKKAEQTAIAHFLDEKTAKIDQAIAQKEQLIALLKERKQIIIQNAVTKGLDPNVKLKDSGVEWIGEIPEHWEVTKFKNQIRLRHGHQFLDHDFTEEGIDVVKITQLHKDGYLDLSKATKVSYHLIKKYNGILIKKGDVLMCLTGGTIGKIIRVGEIDRPLLQNYRVGHFSSARSEQIDNDYIFYLMSSEMLQAQIYLDLGETGQPNIGMEDMKNMIICVPARDEQKKIVTYLEGQMKKSDNIISQQQTQIEKLKEYKATLIDSAVTGKIKVC